MNILLLGSQHGNELLGELLYAHIQNQRKELLPYTTFIIGNPKARNAGVRYLESDMNRSYDPTLTTYEAERAREIEATIMRQDYDLVLDLHTTVCVQPPSFIVARLNDRNTPFLRASSISHIVHMRHPMVALSLIGRVRQAVAIEVSNNDITPNLLNDLCEDLQRYIDTKVHSVAKRVYPVDELILKKHVTPEAAAAFVNFQRCEAGFIPILTGENSYKKNTPYLGFKATQENIITL